MFLKNFWKRLKYVHLFPTVFSPWANVFSIIVGVGCGIGGALLFPDSLLGLLYGVSISVPLFLILLFLVACVKAALDDVQVVTEVYEEDGKWVMKGVTNKQGKVVMVVPPHLWPERPDEKK